MLLAESASETGILDYVIWIAVVIIALAIFGVVVAWLRKRMAADDTPVGTGFTLGDIRALHKQGKMTDEEFERAKTKILGATKAQADAIKPLGAAADKPPKPRRKDPPNFPPPG